LGVKKKENDTLQVNNKLKAPLGGFGGE
jgi:hypothetical protein